MAITKPFRTYAAISVLGDGMRMHVAGIHKMRLTGRRVQR
jgi:hypothetical protein